MNNVVDIRSAREKQPNRRAKISISLRNLSRQCRHEILSSFAFQTFWFGQITREQYIHLLQTHLYLRESLEGHFDDIGETFRVVNQFNDEQKAFDVRRYVTAERRKSLLLRADLMELTGSAEYPSFIPEKALELTRYMARAKDVYSVSLLGILYMLEETITYAGTRIADSLDKELELQGIGTRYLRGSQNQKQDLWRFRRSLDVITDFQTQANIVIASTLTYRMYRDLLDPKTNRRPPSKQVH